MIIELRKCIAGGFTVHEEVKPWTTPRTFHESAFTTLAEALAFIRSRIEPEGEGEKGKTAPDHIEWFDDHKAFKARIDADRAAALNKLQAEGQKFDATPTDPPWKRAKFRDIVLLGDERVAARVWAIDRFSLPPRILVEREGKPLAWLKAESVREVLPTPPRHGDFGSRPEEDGA